MPLISFNPTPQRDGSNVTATLDTSYLVSNITSGDSYLDNTNELQQINVYYQHKYTLDGTVGNREQKRFIFLREDNFETSVKWSLYAKDGTWAQTKIRVFDREGADSIFYDGTHFVSDPVIFTASII